MSTWIFRRTSKTRLTVLKTSKNNYYRDLTKGSLTQSGFSFSLRRNTLQTTPLPILRRLILTLLVGISCFLIGIIYYLLKHDIPFLTLSLCILLCSIVKSYALLITIQHNAYTVIEGTCKSMTRLLVQNCNKFILEDANGNRNELLLGKNVILTPGENYRIYFKYASGISPGNNPLMEKALLTNNFLGFEQINGNDLSKPC